MYLDYPSQRGANTDKFFKIHVDIFVGAAFTEESLRRFVAGYHNIHRCCHIYSDYSYCMDVRLACEAEWPAFQQLLYSCVPGIDHVHVGVISDVLKPQSKRRH